jgi:hypothetical protein
MRRLTPVLFPIAWPGPDYAEGLFIGMDGDVYVVWAEMPYGGGWRAQAALHVERMPYADMSEQLRRQHVRMSGVDGDLA